MATDRRPGKGTRKDVNNEMLKKVDRGYELIITIKEAEDELSGIKDDLKAYGKEKDLHMLPGNSSFCELKDYQPPAIVDAGRFIGYAVENDLIEQLMACVTIQKGKAEDVFGKKVVSEFVTKPDKVEKHTISFKKL